MSNLKGDLAGGSQAAVPRARSFGVSRVRVELRPPLSEPVFAADFYAPDALSSARYIESRLLQSRMKLPHTLHWPITLIAYDVNGETLWEEVDG